MTLTPAQRSAIYGVAVTTVPLLVLAGIVSEHAAPLVLAQVESILALVVAFAHRPTLED